VPPVDCTTRGCRGAGYLSTANPARQSSRGRLWVRTEPLGSQRPAKQSSVVRYWGGFGSRGRGTGVAGCRGLAGSEGWRHAARWRWKLSEARRRGKPSSSQRWCGSGGSTRATVERGFRRREARQKLGMRGGEGTRGRRRSYGKVAREGGGLSEPSVEQRRGRGRARP
jgi:hypothetical protein